MESYFWLFLFVFWSYGVLEAFKHNCPYGKTLPFETPISGKTYSA